MALHSLLDGNHISRWNRLPFLVLRPPVVGCSVWTEVSALFGRRRFTKHVGYTRTKNDEVLHCSGSVEDPGSCMVDTIGICVSKNADIPVACGTIHCASGFLPTIENLLDICPDKTTSI